MVLLSPNLVVFGVCCVLESGGEDLLKELVCNLVHLIVEVPLL